MPRRLPSRCWSFVDDAPLLEVVDLDHGAHELEVVAAVARQQLEEGHVLREAAAPVADARAQIARPDPPVEAHPVRDLVHVRADRLGDVRDLVDEADPRREERVRRELDHLGGRDARAHDGRVESSVKSGDSVARRVVERADHDPVRVREVLDRTAFREELGVGDIRDPLEPALVERRPDLLPRPHRDGALHDERRLAGIAEVVDHRPDVAEIRVTRGRGRRVDAREEDPRIRLQVVDVERERQPVAVPLDQLREAGLVERDAPGAQLLDLLGHDVADDDPMAELGEARTRDEADPPGPEDAEGRLLRVHAAKSTCGAA